MDIEKKHEKAAEVIKILDNPPDGRSIQDPDTILKDFMDAADYEITGIARELILIWQKSTDKASFEALFELLAGDSFEKYLDTAVERSTRQAERGAGNNA